MTAADNRYLPLSGLNGFYRRFARIGQMGNEASSGLSNSQKNRRASYDPNMDILLRRRSKGNLKDQRGQESTESSDSGYGHQMVFQKNSARSVSQSRRFPRQRSRDGDDSAMTTVVTSGSPSLGSKGGQFGDFLCIPQICEAGVPVAAGQRKGSCQGTARELIAAAALGADRRRSKSLCNQQIKAMEGVASLKGAATTSNGSTSTSRRSSNGSLPSMTRLRIQQCYKSARASIGQQIIKRACSLRTEMRAFISHLPEETVEQLGKDIFQLISQCVGCIDDPDKITALSQKYGEKQSELCAVGFRPEYFSAIADASIAECVRLDNGAHKRCETLLAWSHLMESMFSSVRDGYYQKIRQQRRLSLPQHRLNLVKQGSFEMRSSGRMSLDSAC